MRPWRCRTCDYRFYGRQSPLAFALYVHCPRCGRFDLQKVHRERMSGGFKRLLSTITRVPAYRCDNCRIKFYSARRYRHIVPAEMAQAREEEAPSADEPAVVEAKPES
jgi:rubrerythrin